MTYQAVEKTVKEETMSSVKYMFGPVCVKPNRFVFRLWAPQAKSVAVVLYKPNLQDSVTEEDILKTVTLKKDTDDWYTVETDASWGQCYHFLIDDDLKVPDPASRYQPFDVFGPSQLIDHNQYQWQTNWLGRPFDEAVFYELHTGTFTQGKNFAGILEKLDYLKSLGITAIELMPVADFPGQFNWGYDGVLLYAPDHQYGHPDDLKAVIDAAHQRGMMVFLDVVYNHFGPEGNFLYVYANTFFKSKHKTPWGNAISFDGDGAEIIRSFFIENTLYWLDEFKFDGLRLDAVHEIYDDTAYHILDELNDRVKAKFSERQVHLVLENDMNQARFLHTDKPMTAQWNDDFHHAAHAVVTKEDRGYYEDYHHRQGALDYVGRCLTEGFAYQGDPSPFREGKKRGEKSSHLHPAHFVNFIQNHDQIGNRAFGERLSKLTSEDALKAITALYLLAPATPMIFMGEEWQSKQPFLFFTDIGDHLAKSIRDGRRHEFAKFPEFSDPEVLKTIPDPCDRQTFEASMLDWPSLKTESGQQWQGLYVDLLTLRRETFLPLFRQITPETASYQLLCSDDHLSAKGLYAQWLLHDGQRLFVLFNASPHSLPLSADINVSEMKCLYIALNEAESALKSSHQLLPWSVIWGLL